MLTKLHAITTLLDGLHGVISIADDISMYGVVIQKKRQVLNMTETIWKSEAIKTCELAKKLQFKSSSVTFVGHKLLTKE